VATKKTKQRYALTLTWNQCSALIDISTDFAGDASFRYDLRTMNALVRKKAVRYHVEKDGTIDLNRAWLLPLGAKLLAASRYLINHKDRVLKAA